MISPSEICVLKLIELLVRGGREERPENSGGQIESHTPPPIFVSKETPLNIMCFLSDLCKNDNIDNFKDTRAFFTLLKAYVPKQEQEENISERIIASLQFQTIDGLVDTIESIPSLITMPADKQVNPNKVISPFVILPESLLGRLLRSVSVKWHNISFEEVCTLYENFMKVNNYPQDCEERDESSIISSLFSPPRSQSFFNLFDDHSRLHDIVPAMDNLHRYYDLGKRPHDLLQFSSFFDFMVEVGPNPNRRHQQAMLSMATVWMRSGNSIMAACAVEEALKQAHQRGDHESVSKALLLLQHILVLSNALDTNLLLRKSILATLQQVIRKCKDANLRVFASQARLLLAQVKMQAPLKIMDHTATVDYVPPLYLSAIDESEKMTPQAIWNDLALVQLGENMETEGLHASGSSRQMLQHLNDSHLKGPMTSDELGVTTPLSLCIVSAEFWCRLGNILSINIFTTSLFCWTLTIFNNSIFLDIRSI